MAARYSQYKKYKGADFDTEHYLVVAKAKEGLSGSKQGAPKFEVKRFNLKKLSN
jgi:hypothetical protein